MNNTVDGKAGQLLWKKADKVLPGGSIYLSRSARFAGEGVLPGFVREAYGCRIKDVDGREYIDFLCANGPNILGYRHPEVEAAAEKQAKLMDLASFYPEQMIQWSEKLLAWARGFDWVVHTKNGSDATDLAVRIMRQATGRPLVILFERAYHGFESEFSLAFENVPVTKLDNIIRIPWNHKEALLDCVRKQGKHIAGILMNPLDQSPATMTMEASADFIEAIRLAQKSEGILVTLDDVRHGLRLHPLGSHQALGLEPDLLCLGKSLANGYATAAVLGKEAERDAASRIQFTSTYIFSAVAFAAAAATLAVYERDGVFASLVDRGRRLKEGLEVAARDTGHELVVSGPVTMPTLLFKGERRGTRARTFCREAALRGAVFHPSLNLFLSAAHSKEDIASALSIAREAFRLTPVT